jgi:transposase-like protein
MNIVIYFDNKKILDYVNNDNSHNKIPYSFEKLSTLINCPSCGNNSIIEKLGYFPSIDSFCHYFNCHHTIEVKSILAEGRHQYAYQSIPFDVKLGSPEIYKNLKKINKTLLIFWYNILYSDEKTTILTIRNCIMYPMEYFKEGFNCSREIVFQRKKIKIKKRLNLKIFPEFSIFKELLVDNFKSNHNFKRVEQIKANNDHNIFNDIKKLKKKLLHYN